MKKHPWEKPSAVVRTLLAIACIHALAVAALAQGGPEGAALEIRGDMRAGSPITALFDLKGYALPAGAYPSVNVRTIASSSGDQPVVKAGYPTTTLTFATPGTYELRFILNEVSKPSCGGVDARPLLEAVRVLTITGQP
jgi:hypothetical protein